MGPTGLTVLRPASHQLPVRPSQTESCSVHPFPTLPPHSASSLVLSARACFLCSATRPVFSFVLWRATCNVLDLPNTPLLPSTRFHYALSRPARPLRRLFDFSSWELVPLPNSIHPAEFWENRSNIVSVIATKVERRSWDIGRYVLSRKEIF